MENTMAKSVNDIFSLINNDFLDVKDSIKILQKINDKANIAKEKSSNIKVPYKLSGNKIQKKIWLELKKIKKGKTKSYGKIAKKYKLSPRHIGKICGQNKLVLLIPCHRVIRTDGSLGGFTSVGGIKLKKKLLEFEKNKKKII